MESWRKKIGLVPQSPILIKGSLEENVAFGVDEVDRAKLIQSLRDAHAYDFIEKMENREKSFIGGASNMSGGQVQRVSISRALYKTPEVILMDEPTSALDSVSERAILKTVLELRENRTIVFVTHDLELTQQCDRIFVLENGNLVESGSYKDLLEKNGKFAKLRH